MVQVGEARGGNHKVKLLVKSMLRGYQLLVSPVLHAIGGEGCGCRFEPTCSQFCLEAVELHGAARGVW